MADKNALVDSGATDNFIHPSMVARMGLGTQVVTVRLVDRSFSVSACYVLVMTTIRDSALVMDMHPPVLRC
jgi:hypothetical protein